MLGIIIIGIIIYLIVKKWTWDESSKYPSLSYQDLIHKSDWDVNTKIQNINISWIQSIWIHINNSNPYPYLVSQKNTLRIVKMVVDNEWKTIFEPNELKGIYNFIIENYKSSLPIKEYEEISNLFKQFVEQGWEIKINYSSQKSSWIWLFFKIIGFLLLIPIILVVGVFIFCLIVMAF
jgi:hypothetical protein